MNRSTRAATLVNLSALTSALVVAVVLAWPHAEDLPTRRLLDVAPSGTAAKAVALTGDGRALVDASGHRVPLRTYLRIVSTNLVTDHLLLELCEPGRILAVSKAAAARTRDGFRYQGLATIDGFGPPEAIVALKPDLVITNSFGAPGTSGRLRNAGIEVFELGELRGIRTFTAITNNLGLLLGRPERAARLLTSFASRMQALPARRGPRPALRALYLSTLGPDLQGGTVGTSYHDIMAAAGLIDVAASRYRDWPAYSAEQVLDLAPDVIVTRAGFAAGICAYPGMAHIPACRGQGRILELSGELLDEPGLAMLDAAEELFAQAYGPP